MNNKPVVTEVSPVRPPASTPEALSTYAVIQSTILEGINTVNVN